MNHIKNVSADFKLADESKSHVSFPRIASSEVSLVVACSLASLSSFRLAAAGKTRTVFEVMRSSYAGLMRDDDSNHLVAPCVSVDCSVFCQELV